MLIRGSEVVKCQLLPHQSLAVGMSDHSDMTVRIDGDDEFLPLLAGVGI